MMRVWCQILSLSERQFIYSSENMRCSFGMILLFMCVWNYDDVVMRVACYMNN
jgi:hypothetical protein